MRQFRWELHYSLSSCLLTVEEEKSVLDVGQDNDFTGL